MLKSWFLFECDTSIISNNFPRQSVKSEYVCVLINFIQTGQFFDLSDIKKEKVRKYKNQLVPECGYKYSEIPIDKGKYQGDNEPSLVNLY